MARLVVEARGTAAEGPIVQGVAAAGNSEARRSSRAGRGGRVEIAMTGGGQRGDYAVRIVPVTYQGTQYTWAVGRYLLFLAVTRGADQGQTVCSVFVH